MYSNLSNCQFVLHASSIPVVWLMIYAVLATFTYYITYNENFLEGSLKALKIIITIIFYFFVIMATLCHVLTILTDPGTIDYELLAKLQQNDKTNCNKCQNQRPQRAHHCSICKVCIMKMDHHCPWVFNCVGFGNQKLFFLFLLYTLLGCILGLIMFIVYFCSNDFSNLLHSDVKRKLNYSKDSIEIFGNYFGSKIGKILMVIFGAVLTVILIFMVIGLFITQIKFICTNTTNVETTMFDSKNKPNPFIVENNKWFMFKTVMGLNSNWKMFLPFVEPNEYNGGYVFKRPTSSQNVQV